MMAFLGLDKKKLRWRLCRKSLEIISLEAIACFDLLPQAHFFLSFLDDHEVNIFPLSLASANILGPGNNYFESSETEPKEIIPFCCFCQPIVTLTRKVTDTDSVCIKPLGWFDPWASLIQSGNFIFFP